VLRGVVLLVIIFMFGATESLCALIFGGESSRVALRIAHTPPFLLLSLAKRRARYFVVCVGPHACVLLNTASWGVHAILRVFVAVADSLRSVAPTLSCTHTRHTPALVRTHARVHPSSRASNPVRTHARGGVRVRSCGGERVRFNSMMTVTSCKLTTAFCCAHALC
jgi:hypothetical protein